MNRKVEFWLTRTVVVIYGLACLLAVVYDHKAKNDMKSNNYELSNAPQASGGMLIWLKELQAKGEEASPYDYEITEALSLTAEQLAVIIAPDNYREQSDIMAMAQFMPTAQVRYSNADGQEEILAFSFVSCEYKKYIEGKITDSGLLGNPDELSQFLESIH
jgi:hypothetical protein